MTWDLSAYDPNELGTQIIYGTLDVAKSWYAYAINEETGRESDHRGDAYRHACIRPPPSLKAPVIPRTFYANEHYETLEASLTGGVAMADGKVIDGTFSFDENELLYGGKRRGLEPV